MARTFQFGPLRIDVEFRGLAGPTLQLFGYASTASAPGTAYTLSAILEERDPVEAALEHVRKMRSALKYGPERYVRLIMMRERKSWAEAQTLRAEGIGLYSVASIVGDEVLAAAEQELATAIQEAETRAERAEAEADEATKAVVAGAQTAYVLGPIRATVTVVGITKDGSVGLEISLEAPNAPALTDRVLSPNPLPSSGVDGLLSETLRVLDVGPEKYAEEFIAQGEPAKEAKGRAEAMRAFGMIVGAQALQQALDAIKVEGMREADQFETEMIRNLEERHKVVKARLDELRRRRGRGQ